MANRWGIPEDIEGYVKQRDTNHSQIVMECRLMNIAEINE